MANDLAETAALEPFREDLLAVAVESTNNQYWVADGLSEDRVCVHGVRYRVTVKVTCPGTQPGACVFGCYRPPGSKRSPKMASLVGGVTVTANGTTSSGCSGSLLLRHRLVR